MKSMHFVPHSKSSGFTLVELLVSISIFAVVTGLVLAKYQSFNGGIILTNMAYEVALTIRQAQSYGINVRQQGNIFSISYGVHFEKNGTNPIKSFILFSDALSCDTTGSLDCVGDGLYRPGTGDALVDTFILGRGITIEKYCIGSNIANPSSEVCSNNSSSADTVDISFNRPDPSAIILGAGGVGNNSYARIRLIASDRKTIRDVIVLGTGQISIQ